MDNSTVELPPEGWRRAWIDGDHRLKPCVQVAGQQWQAVDTEESDWQTMLVGTPELSLVCPEETGRQPNCETCKFCIVGTKHDVTFLKH